MDLHACLEKSLRLPVLHQGHSISSLQSLSENPPETVSGSFYRKLKTDLMHIESMFCYGLFNFIRMNNVFCRCFSEAVSASIILFISSGLISAISIFFSLLFLDLFYITIYQECNPMDVLKEIFSKHPGKIAVVVLLVFISLFGIQKSGFFLASEKKYPEAHIGMEKGQWYSISPPFAVDSLGDPWHGLVRLGSENKVLVYFYGGGMSVSEETAAMGDDMYVHHSKDTGTENTGIASSDEHNPFHDWTILAIPYSTGDLHIGTKEFSYTDSKGNPAILHHNGYNNFRLFMDRAVRYAGSPDTVLVAGWSAGGFGAAFLADEIFTDCFPNVPEKAVLVDSALLQYDAWKKTASEVWGAPSGITDCWKGDNPVLESLQNCKKHWPNAKILYTGSYRDGGLVQYQNYIDTGNFVSDEALGDVFEKKLEDMVRKLLELPDAGVYIWADWLGTSSLTPHTILWTQFYSKGYNGESCASWLYSAMEGDIHNHGLELFEKGIPVLTEPPLPNLSE